MLTYEDPVAECCGCNSRQQSWKDPELTDNSTVAAVSDYLRIFFSVSALDSVTAVQSQLGRQVRGVFIVLCGMMFPVLIMNILISVLSVTCQRINPSAIKLS